MAGCTGSQAVRCTWSEILDYKIQASSQSGYGGFPMKHKLCGERQQKCLMSEVEYNGSIVQKQG
ncbi:hypothetical protein H5410_057622 [Solanum commersonii]|uniref:Uncharacterized protein n=1 Tax=Solanum commersonii TaxID=4109 RepID=A0A9J5WR48_SOLCO|nr:hypothetical protein H5410_057622 [Solanum commersonii]